MRHWPRTRKGSNCQVLLIRLIKRDVSGSRTFLRPREKLSHGEISFYLIINPKSQTWLNSLLDSV